MRIRGTPWILNGQDTEWARSALSCIGHVSKDYNDLPVLLDMHSEPG